GPTAGPVPNAGGMPGGASGLAGGVCAAAERAAGARAAPARPSAERFRKRRRAMLMIADCPPGPRAVHAPPGRSGHLGRRWDRDSTLVKVKRGCARPFWLRNLT